MFAEIVLKGKKKSSFKNLIQTKGQKSVRSVFVLVEGIGTKDPRVERKVMFLMEKNFPDLQSCPGPALSFLDK